jgi:hypothetical protein
LVKVKIAGSKLAPVAIDYLHGNGGEHGGSSHGYVEQGDILARTTFLGPGILGALGLFQAQLLQFGLPLLAGKIRVIEGLHGFVKLLGFIEIAVAGGNQAGDCFMDGLGRIGEMVYFL